MYTNEQKIAIVDRARDAERVKSFLLSNPYVLEVIDRIKTEAMAEIMTTPIDDIDTYKTLRHKIQFADYFFTIIDDDIYEGMVVASEDKVTMEGIL